MPPTHNHHYHNSRPTQCLAAPPVSSRSPNSCICKRFRSQSPSHPLEWSRWSDCYTCRRQNHRYSSRFPVSSRWSDCCTHRRHTSQYWLRFPVSSHWSTYCYAQRQRRQYWLFRTPSQPRLFVPSMYPKVHLFELRHLGRIKHNLSFPRCRKWSAYHPP